MFSCQEEMAGKVTVFISGIMSECFFTLLGMCSVIRIKVTCPTCPVRMLLYLAADLSQQLNRTLTMFLRYQSTVFSTYPPPLFFVNGGMWRKVQHMAVL
jgi:hypothetical protein